MPKYTVKLTGISGGRSPSRFRAGKEQFESSCGIDPDLTLGTDRIPCGIAAPSIYAKFSGANLTANAIAFITCPKTTKMYAVTNTGVILSYTSDLDGEAVVASCAGGFAGGAAYYNNYIYVFGTGNQLNYNTQTGNFSVGSTLTGGTSGATATIMADADGGASGTLTLGNIVGTFQNGETITAGGGGSAKASGTVTGKTDVSRFGPLDQGAVAYLTGAWWGGNGFALLTDTAYPAIRSVSVLPNHWAAVQLSDSCLYFCDYANGFGMIHRIHTKKVTYEGDTPETANPCLYAALSLPLGFYPTSLADYGNDLAVTAVRTVNFQINQGSSALFLWNTGQITSIGPDQYIALPDSMASALIVKNGCLHVFTGSAVGGLRVSEYSGGDTVLEKYYIDDGFPPFPGGVSTYGNRLFCASACIQPFESACVYAFGSRTSPKEDVQNVVTVGTQVPAKSQYALALKMAMLDPYTQTNPDLVVAAYTDIDGNFLSKKGTYGACQSVLNFSPVMVGSQFRIISVRIPLGTAIASGTVITPLVIYDDSTSKILPVISNSNYPGASKVMYKAEELPDVGQNQFKIQLQWVGATVPTPVSFPIEIVVDTFEDEHN